MDFLVFEVRREEQGPSRRHYELTPRRFDGIGPTTPDGVPIALKSVCDIKKSIQTQTNIILKAPYTSEILWIWISIIYDYNLKNF